MDDPERGSGWDQEFDILWSIAWDLVVIGGRLRGNLGELQGRSKITLGNMSEDRFEICLTLLIYPGSILKSSQTTF